ncbi:hypothetical protein F0U59_47535 [Archangium gephyra]|nr:hypothetical protein F0U59_47535 [Archangium gephyra]
MKKTSRKNHLRLRMADTQAQASVARLRLLLGFVLAMYLSTTFSCTGDFGCGHTQQLRASR